ncbi:hypothetical protein [Natronomonas sp. EA1]|uniref:hypothetical protein n=1 Tax=Natronomonas sp. EA1 TaxID=3421655 RepID=UPI003EBD214D
MYHTSVVTMLLTVLLVSSLAPISGAHPPRPGTDDNGLNESEAATLWSGDNDSRYITNAAYRDAYGENRTTVHQLANGTDLTFTQPPSTAARWTRADHEEFTPGGADVSLYPPHAAVMNGLLVRDAHATVFAVTPSTTTHPTPTESVVYAAPTGTLRGIVDYRVAVPEQATVGSRTTSYSLASHRIDEVRLRRDGEVIATDAGTHRPELPYELSGGSETLRLEADIHVEVTKAVTIVNTTNVTSANGANVTSANRTWSNETHTTTRTTVTSETVTVSDTVELHTYDLRTQVSTARYPDGDRGIAVLRNVPWQGIQLTDSHRVRGVWRFYTARDTRWDTLVRSTVRGTTRTPSPALPVAVHAYPSKLGPRTEPTGNGPELLEVWGIERPSPSAGLPENVTVDVVEQPYTTSYGLAIRTSVGQPETTRVRGIVRGVNATLHRESEPRVIRESTIDVRVLSQTDAQARLLVELSEAETGEPIVLSPTNDVRYEPIVDSRDGYIELAGKQLETNASGMATVTVSEPGVYTARYVPGSWLTHDPAYTTAADTARWHPLGTVTGWLELLTTGLIWFLPFALAAYAGRQLGTVFGSRSRY